VDWNGEKEFFMSKMVSKFTLAASVVLAMALTLSCSSDDDDGGGGGNSSSGDGNNDGDENSFTESAQVYILQNEGDIGSSTIWNGNGTVKIRLCKSGDYSEIKIEPLDINDGDFGLFLSYHYQVEVIESIVKEAKSNVDNFKKQVINACDGNEACISVALMVAESPPGNETMCQSGNYQTTCQEGGYIWKKEQNIKANEKVLNALLNNCTEIRDVGTVKNGILELKLPAIPEQYLHNLNTDFECEENTLSFSSADAKGHELMYFSLSTDNGEYLLYNIGINSDISETVSFAYLSKPLEITGEISCHSYQTFYSVDANTAWNKIYRRDFGVGSISSKQSIFTTDFMWVLVEK
jgi:hypothetical protein